jgi:hypothetical protein
MAQSGKVASHSTIQAAAADAAADLARWRGILYRHPAARPRGVAAIVAWRACVRSVESDGYGTHEGAISTEPDLLADFHATSLPLPPLVGDDSRTDKASRLLFERARAKRPGLLRRRIDSLLSAAVGSGSDKRRATIERVSIAARALLSGASFDQASAAAGYATGGVKPSTDKLEQAVCRVCGRPTLGRGQFRARFVVRRPWLTIMPDDLPLWRGFPRVPSLSSVAQVFGHVARRRIVARGVASLPKAPKPVRLNGWLYWSTRERAARVGVSRPWIPAKRQAEFVGHKFLSALRERRRVAAAAVISAERSRVAVTLASAVCGPVREVTTGPVLAWSYFWRAGKIVRAIAARASKADGNHIAGPVPSHYDALRAANVETRPCGRIIARRFVAASNGETTEQGHGVLVPQWAANPLRIVAYHWQAD